MVAGHLAFALLDQRLPRDLSLVHRELPGLLAAIEGGDLGAVAGQLLEPGGWYTLLYALVLSVAGPSPSAFQAIDIVFTGLTVAAGARVAARCWGPAAGLAAALLIGSLPAVVLLGRAGWIHVPEAALVLVALDTWLADRDLDRRRTTALLALCFLLAASLRPSALAWLGPLGLAVAAGSWRRPGRLAMPLTAGLAGLATWAPDLRAYLVAKASARDRYLQAVPDLGAQLTELLTGPGVLAVGLGLLLFLGRSPVPGTRLLQVWAMLPVLLFAAARTGIDNFVAGICAAAVLAAGGLARWPVLGVPLVAAGFLFFTGAQWTPAGAPAVQALGRRLKVPVQEGLRNSFRTYRDWGAPDLRALVDATCGQDPCRLAVDQGLLQPYSEEPGKLELLFLHRPQIEIVELRDGDHDRLSHIDALIHWDCGVMDRAWRARFPGSIEALETLLDEGELSPAWSRPLSGACRPIWFTSGGTVAHPELLPSGNDVQPGPTP